MEKLRFKWRTYWARRSRARIALLCVLLSLTALAILWLALPAAWQRQAQSAVASGVKWIGTLDTRTLLVALIGLVVIEALVLLFVPSYRKYPYLATTPSLIPPVTVYLDGENQHPEQAIKPFMQFLNRRLNGRRADLLYFHRATITAGTPAYKKLRLSGFRPIDVPHNPTGKSEMLEALDRELAMHAFERALLGPDKQVFIIISRDGDYAPLIYRMIALGHRVEVWASEPSQAYGEVQKYLNTATEDGLHPPVEVIDLAKHIPELGTQATPRTAVASQHRPVPTSTVRTKPRNKSRPRKPFQLPARNATLKANVVKHTLLIPSTLTAHAEDGIYDGVARTVEEYESITNLASLDGEEDGNINFRVRGALGLRLKEVLMQLGYGDGSGGSGTGLKYWLDHLRSVHVFKMANETSLPSRDTAEPVDAARRLCAMVRVVVGAALALSWVAADGIVRMHEIANMLARAQFDESELASPLLRLIMPDNDKRTTHTRYFVRSARALGLLAFEDVPGKPDEISQPRLPANSPEDTSDATNTAEKEDGATPVSGEPPTAE